MMVVKNYNINSIKIFKSRRLMKVLDGCVAREFVLFIVCMEHQVCHCLIMETTFFC
jgi:hypothetical protein